MSRDNINVARARWLTRAQSRWVAHPITETAETLTALKTPRPLIGDLAPVGKNFRSPQEDQREIADHQRPQRLSDWRKGEPARWDGAQGIDDGTTLMSPGQVADS